LIDSLDKSGKGPIYPVNINLITFKDKEDWITKKDLDLSEYARLLPDIKFNFYWGYKWVFENKDHVCNLLKGKAIPCADLNGQLLNVNTKLADWNYVENAKDVDKLFDEFDWFHDSILKDSYYESGSHAVENGIMPMDYIRRVTMTFANDSNCSIEMIFEGVTKFNLRPAPDNYDSIIYEASIIVKDATVFFCNDHIDAEEYPDGCTCIKAFSLRWRRI
jgi:hypothetical protein